MFRARCDILRYQMNREKKFKPTWFFCALTSGILLFFLWVGFCLTDKNSLAAETKRLTNPLLGIMKFKELRPFKSQIEETIEREKASGNIREAAVYFRSLGDGITIGINEKEEFCPASILKVPVMLCYYKMAEQNPDILNKKIKYEAVDLGGIGAGVPQESSAKIGQSYSVDELIHFMIAESDNTANKILLNSLPRGTIRKTFDDFGIDADRYTANSQFVSLRIVAGFLRTLYNASYINEELSQRALTYLTESNYKSGIVAGLPTNIVVAHKFGERFFPDIDEKQLHEIAIVYYPNNPYILAVMTKGSEYGRLSTAIRNISKSVYDEVDSQYSK